MNASKPSAPAGSQRSAAETIKGKGYARPRLGWLLTGSLAVLVLDQLTKWAVVAQLGPQRSDHRWGIIEPVLAFEYVENTGAAFGVLRGQGALLTGLAAIVLGGLLAYYLTVREPSAALTASMTLLLGGAAGNLIDRIRLGYVVDFVAVGIWPKFNVADSAISVGVVLLAWHLMVEPAEPAGAPGDSDGAPAAEPHPSAAPPAAEGS